MINLIGNEILHPLFFGRNHHYGPESHPEVRTESHAFTTRKATSVARLLTLSLPQTCREVLMRRDSPSDFFSARHRQPRVVEVDNFLCFVKIRDCFLSGLLPFAVALSVVKMRSNNSYPLFFVKL